jgi:flagellar biosynthesis anti-sigma factor FlgM
MQIPNMRIDDKNLSSSAAADLARAQAAAQAQKANDRASAGRSGGVAQDDHVQLSNLAESVQSLEPDSAAAQARLEQLAKIVASGKYQPDLESVADKLIDDAITSGPAADSD